MRHIARVDTNQREIVQALRDAWYSVQPIHTIGKGCPDILVGGINRHTGQPGNWLMEIKVPGETLTPDEDKFHQMWRGPVHVVHSVAEALRVVGIIS